MKAHQFEHIGGLKKTQNEVSSASLNFDYSSMFDNKTHENFDLALNQNGIF